jgi:hypothetical protein
MYDDVLSELLYKQVSEKTLALHEPSLDDGKRSLTASTLKKKIYRQLHLCTRETLSLSARSYAGANKWSSRWCRGSSPWHSNGSGRPKGFGWPNIFIQQPPCGKRRVGLNPCGNGGEIDSQGSEIVAEWAPNHTREAPNLASENPYFG